MLFRSEIATVRLPALFLIKKCFSDRSKRQNNVDTTLSINVDTMPLDGFVVNSRETLCLEAHIESLLDSFK